VEHRDVVKSRGGDKFFAEPASRAERYIRALEFVELPAALRDRCESDAKIYDQAGNLLVEQLISSQLRSIYARQARACRGRLRHHRARDPSHENASKRSFGSASGGSSVARRLAVS
jgi:hypothetical protein